jgi:ATP-dependent DNA ligase
MGERGVVLVYYAFDLLHLDGRDGSGLQLIERRALLEPLLTNKPGLQRPDASRRVSPPSPCWTNVGRSYPGRADN